MTGQTTSDRRRNFFIILILGALSTISPFSIDMYLAAFPQIAADLHTTVAKVSLSLSSYFIGLAAGQVFYGPVLDRYGRKRPLYAGLALYLVASIACATTHDVDRLIALRLLQALGGCAAQVASVAMVRDFFHVKESAKIFSLLMLILGVSPLLAPTVGSFIAVTIGWQFVFILLAVIVAVIAVVVVIWLPEGHAPDPSVSLRIGPVLTTFGSVLTEPQFYTYTLAGALAFSGLFIYLAGSTLIFMGVYHVSPAIYGGIFALLATGFIGSNQVNIALSRRFTPAGIIRAGLCCQLAVALLFLAGSFYGWYGLAATIVLFFFYLSATGVIYPNAAALALAPFEKNAGSASALLGFCQMGIGALASAGVGLMNAHSTLPIVALMTLTSALGVAALLIGRRGIVVPIETDAQEAALVMH